MPTITMDASPYAIGAIMEQDGHPVICISRKLSATECGYAQMQKEALAIHLAFSRLHKFLFGILFKLVTDHKALQYIFNLSKSIPQPP